MNKGDPGQALVRAYSWLRAEARASGRRGGDPASGHIFIVVPLWGGFGMLLLLSAVIDLFRARWDRTAFALAFGIPFTWLAYQFASGWLDGRRERKRAERR